MWDPRSVRSAFGVSCWEGRMGIKASSRRGAAEPIPSQQGFCPAPDAVPWWHQSRVCVGGARQAGPAGGGGSPPGSAAPELWAPGTGGGRA